MIRRVNMLLSAVVPIFLFCVPSASAQTKHALLIGIDTYEPHGRPITKVDVPDTAGPSRFDILQWPDLDGAVNDVKSMQALLASPKFGFPSDAAHMHVLVQNQATHDAILAAMQKYLVDEPAAGDTVVFYYAGHGSLRYNSKSQSAQIISITPSCRRTLTPAGSMCATAKSRASSTPPSIRASSSPLFSIAATAAPSPAVFRSARRARSAFSLTIRAISTKARTQKWQGSGGSGGPAPNGALVFSATQPDQLAEEWPSGNEAHGAFTMALIESLKALPADASAEDVYKRVKVVMEGMGLSDQQPMLDGPAARRRQALFTNGKVNEKLRVAVASVSDSGGIVLDAGMASELGPGSELVQVTPTGELGTRCEFASSKSPALPARPPKSISGAGPKIAIGDLFEVSKWVPVQSNLLNLWTAPPTLSQEADRRCGARTRGLPRECKCDACRRSSPPGSYGHGLVGWSAMEAFPRRLRGRRRSRLKIQRRCGYQRRKGRPGSPPGEFAAVEGTRAAIASRRRGGRRAVGKGSAAKRSMCLVGAPQGGQIRYSWFRKAALEDASTRSGQR